MTIRWLPPALSVAMALTLACGGEDVAPSEPDPPEERASDPERVAACDARTERLAQTLASLPEPTPIAPVPTGLEPPATSAGRPLAHVAPTVTVRAGGALELDGRALADPEALATDLENLRGNWSRVQPGTAYPAVLHVWVDRDVTLAALRARLSTASDHRIVVLAVDAAPRAAGPRCPESLGSICARLPRLAPRDRPAELQLAWWQAVGDCASLRALSQGLAGGGSTDRAQRMREGLPEAVRACACDVDVDAIEYVAAASIASPFDPPVRSLDLPLPTDSDETTTVGAWASALGATRRDDPQAP